jgi:putative proteasome-type protease
MQTHLANAVGVGKVSGGKGKRQWEIGAIRWMTIGHRPSCLARALRYYCSPMTYCLGIVTQFGLVMASDSRTNAGHDQVNTVRKMHTFVQPGERVFVVLASGSLSCTQSVMTLLRRDFDKDQGLATAATMYDAARALGDKVREVGDIDRPALERDDYKFNVHLLLGGQVKGEPPQLFLIYPQGNPLQATEESPYLQIGETKYGRPILDRGIRFDKTTLEEAAKYALLSMDSTMKSNVTVGPPVDLLAYSSGELDVSRQRRFMNDDPDLAKIRSRWEQALRQAVARLPDLRFRVRPGTGKQDPEESIQLVDRPSEGSGESLAQTAQRGPEGK